MALLSTMIRCFRSGNGTTAVEFAIIALPFFAMLFGIVEIGRVMWIKGTMQYAVEETARYVIVNADSCPNDSGACDNSIKIFCEGRLPGLNGILCTTDLNSSDPDHKFVSIEIIHEFKTLVPNLLPAFFKFNIEAKARINLD